MSPLRRSRRIHAWRSNARCGRRVALLVLVLLTSWSTLARADDELEYGLDERRIRSLTFEGVSFFDEERLVDLLGLSGSPWYAPFRPRQYRRDRLDLGIEMIRGLYRRNGFHRVRASLRVLDENDARGDVLLIAVEEGPRTIIDSIEIVDPEPLEEEDVRRLLRFRAGGPAPARAADLGGDIYRILDAYVARGHLSARVREDVSPGDSTVTVRYTVAAGPAYRVREVEVVGNERVRTSYITRELRLREGDLFEARRIERTEIALLDTGWFRDVGFEPAALDSAEATAILRVRVVERPTGFWELGLGTGSKDRVRLTAAWGDRNVWSSGKGLTVRGRLLGVIDGSVEDPADNDLFIDHEEELLYRHPHLFGSRFTVNSNLFFRNESRPRSALELERAGLLVNTAILSRRASTAEIELGVQRTRKLSLSDALRFDNDRALTRSLTLVITRDTRDDFFQPRRGDLRQVLLQTAGGPLLRGDNSFQKALASTVRLLPLPRHSVLALRAQAGWIEAWWESADRSGRVGGVPLEDRFFAGGSSSVRGYRENSLGPRLREDDEALQEVRDPRFLTDRISAGGNALLLLNGELRTPLPLLSRLGFDGTVFFDAGNVWASWKDFRIDDVRLSGGAEGVRAENAFRTSWGVGLHYRTVVGPLRLEYGIPLRRATYLRVVDEATQETEVVDRDPSHVWHLSLGHAF
jgi:outer membrane protein insertion porin family